MALWHGDGFRAVHGMRRPALFSWVAMLVIFLLAMLAGCAPPDAAVGDTSTAGTNVTHDSVDDSDMLIGVLSVGDGDADRRLIGTFAAAGIKAVYAPAPESAMPSSVAGDSVKGFVSRPVKAIVIAALDSSVPNGGVAHGPNELSEGTAQGGAVAGSAGHKTDDPAWTAALQSARNAGIPVILVDPVRAPSDARLYAEILTTSVSWSNHGEGGRLGSTSSSKPMTLKRAVALAVDDNPHPKRIDVTLNP
ncbi:hypothetical protein GA0061078_0138 [Bifidobacterium bohemicum]|uniref:Uncharacterized protein n=1 Tax=Bifidobacterium bohemicum DSM 22767 TaxID=1437606 RepID=A0A086ZG61_9BIFI|nr:hypothetical protein [Bifidobacterium bohemicum]KFI45511.1 hypothetical protein BBOH_1079 [Bifidobacterium bohemicum DSM 22767]SCB71701.1 hypothetical protein GA0061078_0138 [Bifidobacterium bohemicum]